MSQKVKAKIVKDVTQLVLARRTKMCNFLEYKGACGGSALAGGAVWVAMIAADGASELPFQIARSSIGDTPPFSLCVGSQRETTNSRRWRSSIVTSKSWIDISGT